MIEIQRAHERMHTKIDWLDSWHSFSFGHHYDPKHRNHGLLVVNNDDRVRPGKGFGTHSHSDMEIVTWVLSGELRHRDSEGNDGVLYPGLAQRMSAGRGISHSEFNASTTNEVHFIQMWVVPDTKGIDPSYEQRDINAALAMGGLQPIASGRGHEGAVRIHQAGAVLFGARMKSGDGVDLPDDHHVHLFLAHGAGTLAHGASTLEHGAGTLEHGAETGAVALGTGDAARLTSAGRLRFVASSDTEILVWATV
jgi:redox-sensitive bicupin YhaK (pirin superfamily)